MSMVLNWQVDPTLLVDKLFGCLLTKVAVKNVKVDGANPCQYDYPKACYCFCPEKPKR